MRFEDLKLDFSKARDGGFLPSEYEEEIEPLMSELDNYDGSRIWRTRDGSAWYMS